MQPDTIATKYRAPSQPNSPNVSRKCCKASNTQLLAHSTDPLQSLCISQRPISNISLDSPPDSPMSPDYDTTTFPAPTRPVISLRKPDEPDRRSNLDSPTAPLAAAVNSIMSTASPFISGLSDDESVTDLSPTTTALPAKGKRVEEEATEGVVPDHLQGEHPSLVDLPNEILSMVTDPGLRKAIASKLGAVSFSEMDQLHVKLAAAKDRHNRELKATLIRVEKEVREAFEKELVRQQGMIWHMFSGTPLPFFTNGKREI